MNANTPKHVACLLRGALARHGSQDYPYRYGALAAATEEAVGLLDGQLDPRAVAAELDALRQSLADHAACVRRKGGDPAHRTSQLLGAIEASTMRLELLRDQLTQSSSYINHIVTKSQRGIAQ